MQVTIYSTTICAACHTLEQLLDKIDQPYEKRIVDADSQAMAEFMGVNDGMIGVPFSVIRNDEGIVTKVSGFDQKKFKQALRLP